MSEPLPLLHLHHIARTTRDTAKIVAFYCNVLGFRELPRPPFNFTGAWLFGYGIQIHIIENKSLANNEEPAVNTRDNHIAFATKDAEHVKHLLLEHGVDFKEQVNAGGAKQMFFRDPDGHQIEVAQYPDADPAKGYEG